MADKIDDNSADLKKADEYVGIIDGSNESIYNSTDGAFKKITKSIYNLATYKTAEIAVNIFDSLSLLTFGMQEISDAQREAIIKQVKQRRAVIEELSKDPEIQEIVLDISKSVVELLKIFIETAKDPELLNLSKDTMLAISNSMLDSTNEMMNVGKNMVKIIPGIGDAYIIIDNVVTTAKWSTGFMKDNAAMIGKISHVANLVTGKLSSDTKGPKSDISNSLEGLKQIEGRLSKKIEDAGDLISTNIFPYSNQDIKTEDELKQDAELKQAELLKEEELKKEEDLKKAAELLKEEDLRKEEELKKEEEIRKAAEPKTMSGRMLNSMTKDRGVSSRFKNMFRSAPKVEKPPPPPPASTPPPGAAATGAPAPGATATPPAEPSPTTPEPSPTTPEPPAPKKSRFSRMFGRSSKGGGSKSKTKKRKTKKHKTRKYKRRGILKKGKSERRRKTCKRVNFAI